MINVTHLVHAYRQAPWRVQRQWAGAFLLGVLAFAMVSALYLDVTSRAAIVGREIEDLRIRTAAAERTNADLETKLATLLSTANMDKRARELGFRQAEVGEIHYLVVPGYVPPAPISLAATQPQVMSAPTIPPEYTQSLLDWLMDYMRNPATGLAGGLP